MLAEIMAFWYSDSFREQMGKDAALGKHLQGKDDEVVEGVQLLWHQLAAVWLNQKNS